MATADLINNCGGVPEYQYDLIPSSANLKRGVYANSSNCPSTTKQSCEAQGLGYTWDDRMRRCYFPCPDAYTIDATDPQQCNPRPVLTKAEIYYEILAQAVKDCATLIPAYRDAVAEAGNDPSQVGFPADSGCVNPFDPPYVPPPADSGVYDPSASNGDPLKPADVPPQTDPNGSSGQAGQQNGGIDGASGEPFIPTTPDGTKQDPYVPPPPPAYKEIDEYDASGLSTTLPRDRVMITDEEIEQLPKVNDYGVMTDGDLALRLRQHPTFLDTNPAYLKDMQRYIPSFTWECTITQKEFDLLPESFKCSLCTDYNSYIYTNPSNIGFLRGYAPTITITRNAPSGPPSFQGCPQEVKRVACESKLGYNDVPCSYSGGCNGECKCPQPPAPNCNNPLEACFWEDVGSVFSAEGLGVVADGLSGIVKGVGGIFGDFTGAALGGLGVNPQLLVYGGVALAVIVVLK